MENKTDEYGIKTRSEIKIKPAIKIILEAVLESIVWLSIQLKVISWVLYYRHTIPYDCMYVSTYSSKGKGFRTQIM